MMETVKIRMATPEDAPRLVEIYKPYILHTGITFEKTVPTVETFRKRIENTLLRFPYLVAEENGKIIGYAYANALGEREAFLYSVEIAMYLATEVRHQGIGTKLYQALEEILRKQHIKNVMSCVSYREKEDETLTHASPLFHDKMGFTKVGHFTKCGYKFDRYYDLIWYEKRIGDHEKNPAPFLPIPEL